jgi:hypothetical protein
MKIFNVLRFSIILNQTLKLITNLFLEDLDKDSKRKQVLISSFR